MEHSCARNVSNKDWIENFRMSKEIFEYLCQRLYPIIHRSDTVMRNAISVKKRLAITLWCLATPAEYRTIAHLYGVSRSSVCEIVQETCLAIVKCLLHLYIKFPTGQQLQEVVND